MRAPNESTGYDLTTPGKVVWTLGDQQGTIRDLATTLMVSRPSSLIVCMTRMAI